MIYEWMTSWSVDGAQVSKTVDCTDPWSPHGEMDGETSANYSSWPTPRMGIDHESAAA